MLKPRTLFILLAGLCIVGSAFSDAPAKTAASTSPTWDLKFGYLTDYQASKNQLYYNVSYLGKTLSSKGDALSTTSDYSAGGLADVTSYSAFLQLSRGIPTLGGSLLSAYNTTELTKLLKDNLSEPFRDFNLVVGVDTQVDTAQNTSYTYGLEYKAIPVFSLLTPAKRMPEISSVLKLGFSGLHNVATNGQTSDPAEGTFRAILGWKHSFSNPENTGAEDKLAQEYDSYGSSYDTIDKFRTGVLDHVKHGVPMDWSYISSEDEQQFAQRCLELWDSMPPHNDDEWSATLKSQIKDKGSPVRFHNPDMVVWAEANARYVVTNGGADDRWRSIYSLNLKYYLSRSGTDYLQAQFRNGFTEVNPTTRTNTLLFLAGCQF